MSQDYGRAVAWYLRAAEQGFVAAQERLGVIYSEGLGAPQDTLRRPVGTAGRQIKGTPMRRICSD
jgi:TPR repeat protein